MKSYGQFCSVAKAAEIFCERWTALIIRHLAVGAERFADLQRGVPLMSPTLLSRRLKQLEAEGILERRRPAGGRGFTYHLTRAGREFVPLVEGLGVWFNLSSLAAVRSQRHPAMSGAGATRPAPELRRARAR